MRGVIPIVANLKIRAAQDSDLGAVLDLYRHLHADDLEASREDLSRAWKETMNSPGVTLFVGDTDGEIVTSCVLAIVPNLTRGARPYGLIENVVTRADQRNEGLGSAILRHALEAAWEAGCYKVMLLTGSSRDSTLRFYEEAGFKRGIKMGLFERYEARLVVGSRCSLGRSLIYANSPN